MSLWTTVFKPALIQIGLKWVQDKVEVAKRQKGIRMMGEGPVRKLDLAARVAVVEDRLDRVQLDVKTIADKLDEAVRDIRQDIGDIKNKPNSVSEFLENNWRSVVLCAAIVLGANASVIEMLGHVLKH